MGKLIAILIGLIASSASAYEIQEMVYNGTTQDLFVTIDFEGGNKPHTFTWLVDQCTLDETPNALQMLIDDTTGWDDTGTDPMTATTSVNLSANLQGCNSDEVMLIVRIPGSRPAMILIRK